MAKEKKEKEEVEAAEAARLEMKEDGEFVIIEKK